MVITGDAARSGYPAPSWRSVARPGIGGDHRASHGGGADLPDAGRQAGLPTVALKLEDARASVIRLAISQPPTHIARRDES